MVSKVNISVFLRTLTEELISTTRKSKTKKIAPSCKVKAMKNGNEIVFYITHEKLRNNAAFDRLSALVTLFELLKEECI
ncbi:hypothetical protein [uncultured Fusobacterium sp.]|uniref:hypothetical protein n=1 Tax=uncultured Fusobacterium sp. TaxID=159267 RepID=UPI0025DBEB07|nr:hypothetical protein [uncultured Fusobacterium sp.]